MEALDMMQKDPTAATQKYKDDKEVMDFLKEFSELMAVHFDGMAKSGKQAALDDPNVRKVIEQIQRGAQINPRELAYRYPGASCAERILRRCVLFSAFFSGLAARARMIFGELFVRIHFLS